MSTSNHFSPESARKALSDAEKLRYSEDYESTFAGVSAAALVDIAESLRKLSMSRGDRNLAFIQSLGNQEPTKEIS